METRSIGKLDASVVGLGCNNFGGRIDAAATERVVGAALDAGITLFDTADIYGGTLSEEYLGRALGSRRDEAIVATKFGVAIDDERKGGASAAYIAPRSRTACAGSAPTASTCTSFTFPTPTRPSRRRSAALDALVRAGKVLEIGGSNFSAEQIDETTRISADRDLARFVSVQNEYSLLRRGPERFGVLDACARNGVGFIPYFPLASGVLTGKYRRNEAPPEGTRLAGMPADRLDDALSDKVFDRVEALDGVRARSRPHAARARHRLAPRAPDRRERDRRRDEARAGSSQRRGRRVDPHRRRPPRRRRPHRRRQKRLTPEPPSNRRE